MRVLILGSLPGEASLGAGHYYAHPRNAFWRLTGSVIGCEGLHALAYEARVAQLLAAGLGLWDVVASAERAGSMDAAIRAAEPTNIAALVATLSSLRAVAFNGSKSATLGRRALHGTRLALIDLPSSSPANASIPYASKLERWLALREYLDQ